MQTKISNRDEKKKAAPATAKVNYVEKNDWWMEQECRPQAIIDVMVREGIKDVNKFLLWLVEYEPGYTMNSFTFHRDYKRLEQQINVSVRRYWFPKPFMEHLDGRRKQCEKLEEKGMIPSVNDSIAVCKDIVTKNGYNFKEFIQNVFDVLYKKKNKINTLYFQGVSNSCTIAWSIINMTQIIVREWRRKSLCIIIAPIVTSSFLKR